MKRLLQPAFASSGGCDAYGGRVLVEWMRSGFEVNVNTCAQIGVRFVGSDFAELQLNPVAWSRSSWVILDGVVFGSREGEEHGQVE